jgi:uncharacterized protein (TIGR02302 family)
MMKSVFRSKPTPPETPEDRALTKRFEQKVRLSLLAILFERVWEALLWPFFVVATFLVVSLLDLWSITPPLTHRVLLGAFGLALAVSFLPLIRIALPTREEALRRLETKANVKHRPASSYEDRLGTIPAKETALLWAAHRHRLSRLIQKLRPTWPEPRTDRKDPYAIRALLLVALIAAVLAAGPNGFDRLRSAFSPAASSAPSLLRLDAWVTPPVYTEVPPIVLADGSETVGTGSETFRALSVPERSELIVRARVPKGEKVSLVTSNEEGTVAKAVEPKTGHTEGLIEFAATLNDPGSAEVRIGGATVAKWRFDLIKDEPPTISLMANPTTTPRGALRLLYRADDDHGVANAEARFALAEGAGAGLASSATPAPSVSPEPFPVGPKDAGGTAAAGKDANAKDKTDPLLEPPVMPLQLPRANAKHADGRATQDLTAHPWAGLKVRMTLVARDQAGQAGMSAPYEFVLPERVFTKPLAKAVVEQRKKLVRDPSTTEPVAQALDALTIGGDKVGEDSFTYLSLRDAYWRLMSNPSHEAIGSVVDQLWQIALRIEDGDLPEAERELKSAQDALSQALQKNASPDEIKQLVDNLRDALSRYMQALAQQAQDKGNMAKQEQQQNGDQLLSQQDLDKMLSNIEKLAQAGSKEMAERMLSELKDILERMQAGNIPENAKQQRASRMMKDLNDVISKQQKLLDDTFQAKRQQGERGGEQSQQFEVSPPGQPMDFGPGMGMAPFMDMPGESDQGQLKSQGESGKQGGAPGQGKLEMGQQPQGGQHSGQHGDLAKRQQELRDKLQSLIDRFRIEGNDAPQQFDGAGKSMAEAQAAIGQDELDQATQAQNQALDSLRKGAQSLAEQMEQGGEIQAGQGPGNNGRDPLGRPDRSNRPDLGLSVKVPDEIDIQRAREVLDEIRQRLGDPQRPTFELDYLERLIKPF